MYYNGEIKIFAGSSGKPFAKKMCDYLDINLGKSEVITFSDGNTYVKVGETVRDKDVYLVLSIGRFPNREFTEILFWVDAFKRASASSVTVIMPYYSYAKGDKKDEPRVSIRGRVCADCIEQVGADRIVTMDLHAPQIQGFFKIPVDHLFALPVFGEYIKSLEIKDLVIVAPDAGYGKEARKFAKYVGAPVALGDKSREDHDEKAIIHEVIGEVKGKNAVIVDDFTISAGTLVGLADMLKEKGVERIFACLSHFMANEEALKRIEESPIEMLITSDTVNNPWAYRSAKIKVLSVAPLFAETIERIHSKHSVSGLFGHVTDKIVEFSRRQGEMYSGE